MRTRLNCGSSLQEAKRKQVKLTGTQRYSPIDSPENILDVLVILIRFFFVSIMLQNLFQRDSSGWFGKITADGRYVSTGLAAVWV